MSMCIQLSLFALLIIILLVKCVAVCSSECTDASCGNRYLSHFVSTLKNRKYCPLDEGSQRQCDCDSEWLGTGLHPFKKYTTWKLSEQLLLREFPVDTVKENYVRTVSNALFSAVNPIPFKSRPVLVAYSADVLTKILDLDIESTVTSTEWLDIVSGTITVPGSIPLAHRYGGHQFGVWASQLGDGRAVMIGEYLNSKGERWELQLKGSGKTPYSRQGDGRAVLRSSVREFLCSEAMYYLGIPTSRAASLVLSTDTTLRDQFYNGNVKSEQCAVVLRLAKSWFRFGSLEILTANEELDLLKHLVDFITRMYFIDIGIDDPDKYLMFLNDVVNQTAILMAQWMTVGFTHGVMNTDNFSILSITIDYGPFGFLDGYDPQFVPNTSDDEKRYSFERQPDVGYFNLEKLFSAMQPLLTVRQRSYGRYILDSYVDIYKHQYMKLMRNKLGLQGTDKKDEYLVAMLLKIMAEEKADFTMTFRNLGEISMQDLIQNNIDTQFWSLRDMSRNKYFKKWVELYAKRLNAAGPFSDEVRQQTMLENNPRYILRNWIAQTAIEHVEREDYTMIRTILRILKQPFILQEEAELLGFASRPPYWADKLKVSCSS